MPREIKFRAWDMEKDKFVNKAELLSLPIHHFIFGASSKAGGYILEQFTGLKDKNGKAIYEGDMVAIHASHEAGVAEVFFKDGAFRLYWRRGEAVRIRKNEEVVFSNAPLSLEVIGNIHENPELI